MAGSISEATRGTRSPDIRFPIASISKTYTAAMILQLVGEGRLSLE
jgi:D-alanyl-D-alanine carboxypeptidase